MKYENIKEGIFIERPNRFIAYVEIDGNPEKVHVKNTGRCKELLRKGVRVYLEKAAIRNGRQPMTWSEWKKRNHGKYGFGGAQ